IEKITGSNNEPNKRITQIPEVDYLVEPVLIYSNGNLKIINDGTTTAAWGVEVLKDDSSLTEELVLPGNKVKFPSIRSVWAAFTGSASDAVFERGEALEIPLSFDDKYEVRFGSPSSPTPSKLSLLAAIYNINESYEVILNSFGLNIELSSVIDKGCINDIFDATTNTLIDAIQADELSALFFLNEVKDLFTGSAKSISKCSDIFRNFHGSKVTAKEKYFKKLVSFLDAFSKLETAFVVGKLFGDMAALYDINICRQVVNSNIYPCFTLLKNGEIENQKFFPGENIKLEVKTQLDFPSDDNTVFPEGAEIFWEVGEGDGQLQATSTIVGKKGITDVIYNPKSEGTHVINAYTTDNDLVTYLVNVKEIEFELVGQWELHYFTDDTRTEANQINLINFQ